MKNTDSQELFRRRLGRLLTRARQRVLLYGSVRVLAVGGFMFLLAVWSAGGPLRPGGFLAGGLAVSLAAGLAVLIWTQIVARLLRLRYPRDLVRRVESEGNFANILVAGEEGLRLPERWSADEPVRRELRDRLYRRGLKILDFLSPAEVVPVPYRGLSLAAAALVLVLAAIFPLAAPVTLDRGLSRLLDPRPVPRPVPTKGIYPGTDRDFVVVGQDLELTARDFAGGDGLGVCEIRSGQGMWQPVKTAAVAVPRDDAFLPAPFRLWSAVITNVHEDFSWRFRRGTLVSEPRSVTVRHYPLFTELAGRVLPPSYTGLHPQDLQHLPSWFEVPVGSRLELAGKVNHPLVKACLVTSSQDSMDLDLAGIEVRGSMTIADSCSFHIVLEDRFALRSQAPIEFEVSALPDEPPLVRLSRPEDDGILPLDGNLLLKTEATDDYGLVSLALQTRVLSRSGGAAGGADSGIPWEEGVFWRPGRAAAAGWATSAGPVELSGKGQGDKNSQLQVALDLQIDLQGLELVAGDVLELRVAALDNKEPGPGQDGFSRALRLVLPSAADVLAAQAQAGEQRQGELEEMRRRGRELGADLDRLNRELLKNPLPDWARQQEMEAAIERQKALQEELARLARELQQDLDKLAAGQMTSKALLDKADEVSQLLSQPQGESLEDLLAKMDQAREQVSPQEVAQAIKEVARNQKDMARRLDAALAMLKRMEREQNMEGLASLLEQMIRKQQELVDLSREMAAQENGADQENSGQDPEEGNQSADQGGKKESDGSAAQSGEQPSAEEMARRQEALAQELEQLQEKLAEALDALREEQADGDQSPSAEQMEQALQQALENLEKQKQNGDMQKASEQLAQLDPQQAAEFQQQALRDLGSLYHVLIQSQQAMQMAMQQHQISALRQLAADMLALSTRQEEIAARIPAKLRDVRTLDLTRSQYRLQKAAVGVRERLSLLMDESPTRIMKLLGKLDVLIGKMGVTVQAMEDNRAATARSGALDSLAETNRLVIGLLTEAQINSQSSSGGSGNPQQSMAQKLQQMAMEQAKLNGMTEQLRQMLANRGLSQATRAQMKRLGECQGNLGGQLKELEAQERENPSGERLLGDLGELGRQMERISGDLDEGLVSEETLVRQERILSRLLDARNSVRRRDYTTRRESRTAANLYGDMESQVGPAEGEDRDNPFRLRYQALEKAPLEYRDLVRRYFAALDSLRRLDTRDLSGPEQSVEGGREDMP